MMFLKNQYFVAKFGQEVYFDNANQSIQQDLENSERFPIFPDFPTFTEKMTF